MSLFLFVSCAPGLVDFVNLNALFRPPLGCPISFTVRGWFCWVILFVLFSLLPLLIFRIPLSFPTSFFLSSSFVCDFHTLLNLLPTVPHGCMILHQTPFGQALTLHLDYFKPNLTLTMKSLQGVLLRSMAMHRRLLYAFGQISARVAVLSFS